MQYIPNLRVHGSLTSSSLTISENIFLKDGASIMVREEQHHEGIIWSSTDSKIVDADNADTVPSGLDGRFVEIDNMTYVANSDGTLRTYAQNASFLASDHPAKSHIHHYSASTDIPDGSAVVLVHYNYMQLLDEKISYGSSSTTSDAASLLAPSKTSSLEFNDTVTSVDIPSNAGTVILSTSMVAPLATSLKAQLPIMSHVGHVLNIVNNTGQNVKVLQPQVNGYSGPKGFEVVGSNALPAAVWHPAFNETAVTQFIQTASAWVPVASLQKLFDGQLDVSSALQLTAKSWRLDLTLVEAETVEDVLERYGSVTWVAPGLTGLSITVEPRDANLSTTSETTDFYVHISGTLDTNGDTYKGKFGIGVYGVMPIMVDTSTLGFTYIDKYSAGLVSFDSDSDASTVTWSVLLHRLNNPKSLSVAQSMYANTSEWATDNISLTGVAVHYPFGLVESSDTFVVTFTGKVTGNEFTIEGTNSLSIPEVMFDVDDLTSNRKARVLLVGGGGSGGADNAGGGGAGGLVEVKAYDLGPLGTPIHVVVGLGGAKVDVNLNSKSGESSRFGSYRALGGGGGGTGQSTFKQGKNGGSGGGSAGETTTRLDGGLAITNSNSDVIDDGESFLPTDGLQGHNGGRNYSLDNDGGGGGGGGAGGAGGNAPDNKAQGKAGDPKLSDITGADLPYAQGGEGGCGNAADTIDHGYIYHIGGRTNANSYEDATGGQDGTGSGGGGFTARVISDSERSTYSGKGGNGVVIVRLSPIYKLVYDDTYVDCNEERALDAMDNAVGYDKVYTIMSTTGTPTITVQASALLD